MKPLASAITTGLVFAALAGNASASMGNSPSTYGLLPADIGSAQALSVFNSQVSAVYYNPAALAKDGRGELTMGLMHADHDLQASNRTINDTPSQQVLIGMKTDLSSLTTTNHPLYFALMAGVEKYGEELMAFDSSTSLEGQYLNYGRQPLFLSLGGGTRIWRGINAGLALRVTLHSDATLNTWSQLNGEMSQEQLNVSARPVAGLTMNWGETFCTSDCWMNNLETALAYRGYSNTRTRVSANAIIPGTIPAPGLDLSVNTLDSFQPDITTLGVKYSFGDLRLGVTAEYQAWQRLGQELKRDTVKDQANANFKDILIPRIGVEFDLSPHLTMTAGIALEESPLEGRSTLDVNYLDSDRTVIGLGLSANVAKVPLLAWPLQLDIGYQYHKLDERSFDLTSTDPQVPTNPYDTVKTSGDVHVFAGSITLKF